MRWGYCPNFWTSQSLLDNYDGMGKKIQVNNYSVAAGYGLSSKRTTEFWWLIFTDVSISL